MDGIGQQAADTHACPISITALADGAANHPLLDEHGAVIDPLVTVDLATPATAATLERATAAAKAADRILIAVAHSALDGARTTLVESFDLTLLAPTTVTGPPCVAAEEPLEAATRLYAAAQAHPHPAVLLAHLLRTTARMGVPDALDIESLAYSTLLGGPEFADWLACQGPRRPPRTPPGDPVLLERHGDLLRITLNRPERRNAYGRELRDALVDALHLAELDEHINQVVLAGAGPSFCAGGDLAEFGTTPDLSTAHWIRTRAGAGRLLHRLAHTVEPYLHGSCVGAGVELPAFSTHVTADPDTTFQLPEVSMGLIPGAGGTVSIPRRIGRWRTLWLALSGAPLAAPTARQWGLVDELEATRTP